MTAFKVGDRVRVRAQSLSGFAGQSGGIVWVYETSTRGEPLYRVCLDGGGEVFQAPLYHHELEPELKEGGP